MAAELEQARLHSLSCPFCAGGVYARVSDNFLRCEHCGTAFLDTAQGGYTRRYFPARVTKLEALAKAREWLANRAGTPSDLGRAPFVDARLLYFPIWEVRAYVTGWVFGKEARNEQRLVKRGEQEMLELEWREEPVQRGILGERRYYRSATDLTGLRIARPHITGRELSVPFLPGELEREAAVIAASLGLSEVQHDARKAFLHPPAGLSAAQNKLWILRQSNSLLLYPLWILKYSYRRRTYSITVDGRNGLVHSASAPADNRRAIAAMVLSQVALAMVLGVLTSLWKAWGWGQEITILTAIVFLALASGVALKLPTSREVEYNEPYSS